MNKLVNNNNKINNDNKIFVKFCDNDDFIDNNANY